MIKIPFFDLKEQYHFLKNEIEYAVLAQLESGQYIGGNAVKEFEIALSNYLNIKNVISCGNGTDALMLALMCADLPKDSSILVPTFNYVAAAEVCKLLGFNIVFADVCPKSFNINLQEIKKVCTPNVKAILVTHLFGQRTEDIEDIAQFCIEQNILLIEDCAQSIGTEKYSDRNSIFTTSFFPTKNLACYGDGGAVMCHDDKIAEKVRRLANHGQIKKYFHQTVGINSRLDAIQAKILLIKLKHLDTFLNQKKQTSLIYDEVLKNVNEIQTPEQNTKHTFHQFTIKVEERYRDDLKRHLEEQGIETNIYYPLCLHQQEAYLQNITRPNAESLCRSTLSLPIYPELNAENAIYISNKIKLFFEDK